MADMLPDFPVFRLSPEGVQRTANGCVLDRRDGAMRESRMPNRESLVRLVDPAGALVGIAGPTSGPGFLHPIVVLM
jgi:hypothetical protein